MNHEPTSMCEECLYPDAEPAAVNLTALGLLLDAARGQAAASESSALVSDGKPTAAGWDLLIRVLEVCNNDH